MLGNDTRSIEELLKLEKQLSEAKAAGVDLIYIPFTWKESLRLKWHHWINKSFRPWDVAEAPQPEQDKMNLLYDEMMKDINASNISENIKTGLDPLPAVVGFLLAAAGGGAVSAILSSLLAPYLQTKLAYTMNRQVSPYRFDANIITQLWLRGFPSEETKEHWWSQVQDFGWNAEQIEAAKELAYPLPSIADFIFFARRDIFDEDVVKFYDYDGNYPAEMEAEVAKSGITPERWKWHWRAHWRDIEWGIANLLLHRGQISSDEHKMILRTANYPPGILDKMLESSWDLPNRIEMRMMTRYLDLDKTFVVDMLGKVGLKEEYRSDAADFMLVMGLRTDISTRYSKGWITAEQVAEEIAAKGLSEAIATKLYKWIVKNVQPERVEEYKTLTRALIMKGAKLFYTSEGQTGLNREEAILLLMRHQNYAEAEANYIFAVEEAGWGSPESPLDFRKIVEEGRKAMGEDYIEIPPEVLEAEKESRNLALRLSQAISREAPQEEIDELKVLEVEARVRYDELRVSTNL